jgi:hypothetical protein
MQSRCLYLHILLSQLSRRVFLFGELKVGEFGRPLGDSKM